MNTSAVVLGAMMFGTTVDEATSFALLDRFVEAGGEWIDTADCYSFWASDSGFGGQSEAVLGRWLAARPGSRERVKIATKVGAEPTVVGGWPEHRKGLSPAAVREAFAGSLRRLGVDSVDRLWLHQEDRSVSIEDTLDAVDDLVGAGQVGRVGVSNHPAWRVEQGRRHARQSSYQPIDAIQLRATYLRPRPGGSPGGNEHPFGVLSDEQLDHAAANGLEIWAYTPLLSGAYDNPAKPIDPVYDHPGSTRRLAALTTVADELGVTRGQVVLAWLAGGKPAIRPMLGGSKLFQLDAAMVGAALELPAELRQHLDLAG